MVNISVIIPVTTMKILKIMFRQCLQAKHGVILKETKN